MDGAAFEVSFGDLGGFDEGGVAKKRMDEGCASRTLVVGKVCARCVAVRGVRTTARRVCLAATLNTILGCGCMYA